MEIDGAGSTESGTQVLNNHTSNDRMLVAAADVENDSVEIVSEDNFQNKHDSVYEGSPTTFSADGTIHADESLLQEAVDSILI